MFIVRRILKPQPGRGGKLASSLRQTNAAIEAAGFGRPVTYRGWHGSHQLLQMDILWESVAVQDEARAKFRASEEIVTTWTKMLGTLAESFDVQMFETDTMPTSHDHRSLGKIAVRRTYVPTATAGGKLVELVGQAGDAMGAAGFDNPTIYRAWSGINGMLQTEQLWDSITDYEASRSAVRNTPGITSIFDQIYPLLAETHNTEIFEITS